MAPRTASLTSGCKWGRVAGMHTASILIPLMVATGLATAAPSLYPGAPAGKAQAQLTANGATIGNELFTASYGATAAHGATFKGLKAADGTALLQGGTPLFSIKLQDGRTFTSENMQMSKLKVNELEPSPKSPKTSEHDSGFSITGTFTAPDSSFTANWSAVLRDGSHYLRQHLSITAKKPLQAREITALEFNTVPAGELSISGNTSHGRVVVNDKLFMGLETPMSIMTAGSKGAVSNTSEWTPKAWQTSSFGPVFNLPASFRKVYGQRYAATNGPVLTHLKQAEGPVTFTRRGECSLVFQFKSGNHKLHITGVQLLDAQGQVVSEDVHEGSTGHSSTNNTYVINVPAAGDYRLRYWVQTRTESINSSGSIAISLPLGKKKGEAISKSGNENLVRGIWQREAPLAPGQTWEVSGAVGLIAPGQQRRSFLAYVERERAVAYRPFIHYNDWYEIGIRIHDNPDPMSRTSEAMWLKLLDVWHRELYTKRNTKLDGFILDDGWDEFNSLWDFHAGFPNGFSKMAQKAAKQGAGLGTWLGPVGGYGASKQMRLDHWNRKHPNNKIDNFQLSNAEYFNAFVERCTQMIRNYGMRYFKFDGISTKFHAKGPEGIEDAEGILSVIAALRQGKPDVFINTTVGTWASPFWFFHADAVWRQENDFDQAGSMGDARDRWITYRDRLVHEVFVQGAPLLPLNSLMTHGTMITKNGPPRIMSKDPANCRKEMRMAFGCGSSLQEVYADTDLMCQQGGVLWDELAACIAWVRRNKDVLPDVHWVGGNPWNGHDGSIYGYAAWNKTKSTLTLRNSSDKEKTLSTTLREVLDVPPALKGTVTFKNSFADQRNLPGLTGKAVDVDAPLTITMKPQEVIVLEGVNAM